MVSQVHLRFDRYPFRVAVHFRLNVAVIGKNRAIHTFSKCIKVIHTVGVLKLQPLMASAPSADYDEYDQINSNRARCSALD
jgi:hypothetical protein